MSDDGGPQDHEGADGADGTPPLPEWTPPDPPAGGARLPFGPSTATPPPAQVGPAATPPPPPAGGSHPGAPASWPTSPPPRPPASAPDPAAVGWAPPSPPPPPPAGWDAPDPGRPPGPGGWSPPGQPLPVYAANPSTPPPGTVVGKGRSRAALAILSVTAVLAASTFAFVALTRPDGAGSPEEAVEALFAALEAEDAVGVMEALPPGEREVLLEPMVATVAELQRLGVFDSFALEDVPGADIEVDGLALRSTNLGDGITSVRVTGGTITGTVLPDEVPIGPRTRDLIERHGGEPLDIEPASETESLADADLELVTIEEDGGWHVSLFYTIAEAARGDAPLPVFGQGVAPIGADSPEDAVRQLVQAGVDLDLERVIGYLPPDEMRVLYDYAPLFLDDARAAADETRANGFTASVDRLDLRVEGDGETRRVTVEGMDVRAGIGEGESARITSDGACTVLESTYRTYTTRFESVGSVLEDGSDSVETGGPGGGPTERFDDEGDLETTRMEVCEDGRTTMTVDGESVQEDTFDGMDPLFLGRNQASFIEGLTVVEHDGRWYVSPVRSMFDSFLTSLRGLDGSEIDAFFESFDSMLGTSGSRFEELESTIPGGSGSPGTTFAGPDPTDPYLICAEVYDDLDPDADADEWEAIDEAYDQCLIDLGEEPFEEPASFGGPRLAGGHVLVPVDGTIAGYDLAGTAAFDGPACEDGAWTTATVGRMSSIEVAWCDGDELVAVDGATGAERWRRPAGELAYVLVGPTAVLVLDDSTLTVLDLETGAERWTQQSGFVDHVSLDDTGVFVATGTSIVAHELESGAERWSVPLRPSMVDALPGALVIRTDDGVVHRLDPATGATVWSSEAALPSVDATVVSGATTDVVVVSSADGSGEAMVFDLASGSLLWSRSGIDESVGAVAGGTSVVVSDRETGSLLVLDHRTAATGPGEVAADVTRAVDLEGNLVAYVVTSADGTPVIATFSVP